MREYIITKEYNGTLIIENTTIENVRCLFDDDFYSNKLKEGKFIISEFSVELERKLSNNVEFRFFDISGRILTGKINGFRIGRKFNEHKNELKFYLDEYSQIFKWSNAKGNSLIIKYNIPYIKDLSRNIRYSHDLYPKFIFKFTEDSKKIIINNQEFEFYEKVYCYEYKEPDSILARELFLKTSIQQDDINLQNILNANELIIKDMMKILSFLFNHWMMSYGYNAELLDVSKKLIESITYKNYKINSGTDYLKKANPNFKEYFRENNLSIIIENYVNKDKLQKENIEKLINKFLSLNEIKILEAKFLSGYVLLESISKSIVKPPCNTNSESLIKDALVKSNIQKEEFKVSRHRVKKNTSKNEFEITEYRDMLVHFNELEFEYEDMALEYDKIMRTCRRLIIWLIEPTLSNWGFPEE